MTVPKTALIAALLLAVAAMAAPKWLLFSYGPYEYDTRSVWLYYLPWFAPHAVPMNLTFLNVTWWKPEAIWFVGKYYVHAYLYDNERQWGVPVRGGYIPATIYVVQYGVRMVDPRKTDLGPLAIDLVRDRVREICRQGTAMVAPVDIIVLNATTQVWISDIYCQVGNQWFWLRLLPYLLEGYVVGDVEEVNASGLHIWKPVGPSWPFAPAGWYIDPLHKIVFRLPDTNMTLLAKLQETERRLLALKAELANRTAQLAQLNVTVTQLNMTVAQLNASLAKARGEVARLAAENQRLKAQLEALNATRIKLEGEVLAYKSQLEALKSVNASLTATLARLEAENQALKAQLNAMLNKTLSEQTAQLRSQLETWTRAAWIGAALGAAAGAAVTVLALRRRK
jgi:regulator of replication initiation timing